MNEVAQRELRMQLSRVGLDPDVVAAVGGGLWCFGSRAVDCAREDSDWDILLVQPDGVEFHWPEKAIGRAKLDLTMVSLSGLSNPGLAELLSHVAEYGSRIDRGGKMVIPNSPLVAAPRKQKLVVERARHVALVWKVLQRTQQLREAVRLRRDIHRALLLSEGEAVPPTALLDAAWERALAVRPSLISWMSDDVRAAITCAHGVSLERR